MRLFQRQPRSGVLFVCMGNICRSPTAEGVFRQMVKEAGSVVVASHSFSTLRQVCTRLLLFERGRLIAQGKPHDVIAHYMKDEPPEVQRANAAPP